MYMHVQSLPLDVCLYHFPQGIYSGLSDLVHLVASLFWESFLEFRKYYGRDREGLKEPKRLRK